MQILDYQHNCSNCLLLITKYCSVHLFRSLLLVYRRHCPIWHPFWKVSMDKTVDQCFVNQFMSISKWISVVTHDVLYVSRKIKKLMKILNFLVNDRKATYLKHIMLNKYRAHILCSRIRCNCGIAVVYR